MTAQIIDGKAEAERLRGEIALAVAELKSRHGLVPGLAVVLVGEDPASALYVRNKGEQTKAAKRDQTAVEKLIDRARVAAIRAEMRALEDMPASGGRRNRHDPC